MRLREGLAILALAGAIAACSGSGPGSTDGNDNGGPTAQPQPTSNDGGPDNGGPDNGGPGNPDFTYGKVTFEVSGPIEVNAEYGFVPPASLFGGPAGSSLNFTDNIDSAASLLTIIVSQDGTVVVSFTGPSGTIPAASCETSNWDIGTTSGSGSFDCTAQFTMMPSGATVQGGRITGTFNAHA
jgi:hypothetical protein